MVKKYNVVDLFSGCGGFSYGFEQAGFNVVLGVDNNEDALETFALNHKNSEIFLGDLHNDDSIEKIVELVRHINIDVLIAGPPCQGFSLTGTRNLNDKRNTLFQAVFKLADRLTPDAIVIENVPGLATLYNGKAKKEIIKKYEELGYNCTYEILFAPDFEVPQIRRRIFFVGLKQHFGFFKFPEKVLDPENYNTCEDAIGDLPCRSSDIGKEVDSYTTPPYRLYQKKMRGTQEQLYNHVGTKHTEHVIKVISQVPEGGNHKDLPPGVGDSRKFNEAWTRYHRNKPSRTIDTGHRNHFHYKWNRVPTVRENARLQSFPDSFVFKGTKTSQYRQVGNAVPPLLGYHIAIQLLKFLSNEKI